MLKRLLTVLFLLSLPLCQVAANDAIDFDKAEGVLTTGTVPVTLSLEIAVTPAQQRMGLMFRKTLPPQNGMLFLFNRQPAMWMKNTYLPLDMLFINAAGEIVDIVHDTTPFSEEVINSRKPASAVLEINAGMARQWGVKPGDVLHVPGYLPQQ